MSNRPEIFVTTWSLRPEIQRRGLDVLALPAFVTANGFDGMEIGDREIGADLDFAAVLAERCRRAGCAVAVDVTSDLTSTNSVQHGKEVRHIEAMLEVAAVLEARAMRITLGGQTLSVQKLLGRRRDPSRPASPSGPGLLKALLLNRATLGAASRLRKRLPPPRRRIALKLERAAGALRRLAPRAEIHRIPLAIENHWGVSALAEHIVRVVKAVDSPWVGSCPDFGNFPSRVDRYAALSELAPFAKHVQAKAIRFTAAGEERDIDYARCLRILKDAGYTGPLSVEYEGRDGLAGCLRTRALILRHW